MKTFLKRYIFLILIVLVVALALASTYFYKKAQALKNPDQTAQVEAKELAKKVGELAIIPQDEVPTIATVTDPEALKDQAFFAEAKVGYKVLIYTNTKKAVLYDPSSHKIVNIAPLNMDQGKAQTVPTSAQ